MKLITSIIGITMFLCFISSFILAGLSTSFKLTCDSRDKCDKASLVTVTVGGLCFIFICVFTAFRGI